MAGVSILNLSREQLAEWCQAQGEGAYRADQIRRWVFEKRISDFGAMTDLPAALRARLAKEYTLFTSRVTQRRAAADGTVKLLVELADGHSVECVLMREGVRRTICLSTQVGCGMGCVFCASGLAGVARNLTSGEIVEQMLHLDHCLGPDERITHVVVMGMGEPLANLDALLAALESATGKGGLGLSARHVTISTVGLPEKIRQLAAAGKPYHLAVSLHAPDDELRNELVPVNRQIGIDPILAAGDDYFRQTGRQVTFEYVLLAGINDSVEQAGRLGQRLAGRKAHVNLIPFNPVAGLPFRQPQPDVVRRFVEVLGRCGVSATVRKRKGSRIDAACGQLRRSVAARIREAPKSQGGVDEPIGPDRRRALGSEPAGRHRVGTARGRGPGSSRMGSRL